MANRFRMPESTAVVQEAVGSLTDMSLKRPNDGVGQTPTNKFLRATHEPQEKVNPAASVDIRITSNLIQNRWTVNQPVFLSTVSQLGGRDMKDLPEIQMTAYRAALKEAHGRIKKSSSKTGIDVDFLEKMNASSDVVQKCWLEPVEFMKHFRLIGTLANVPQPLDESYIGKTGMYGSRDRNIAVLTAGALYMSNIFNRSKSIGIGDNAYMIIKKISLLATEAPTNPAGTVAYDVIDRNYLNRKDRVMVFVFVTRKDGTPCPANITAYKRALDEHVDPPITCSSYLDFDEYGFPLVKPAQVVYLGKFIHEAERPTLPHNYDTSNFRLQNTVDITQGVKPVHLIFPTVPVKIH